MKAILNTRCGCSRTIEIPYPPQRYIRVPLKGKTPIRYFNGPIRPPLSLQTREFNLVQGKGEPGLTAIYEEAEA